MKKQLLFRSIAILLPFVLIFILEIGLRIGGYGASYQQFHGIPHIENKPDYLVMNKKIAGKYFKDNGLHSDNQSDLFLKLKLTVHLGL